ncbi:metal ABC transporter permease [Denitrobacterium detoxificans]|uniref:D-methionine transport system permease protein n=1 Tax=Denitrobacterium detoxificans TaxID=79604 RepID=A0A172S018_9ACTN|nr:methionine ABC transporter permease [Denitrobacterium detoxificans]ANE23245.1 metal ABC transporter permease [Denitrobacterium detoxificans]SEO37584.1 D-methionine transport system permease protein [Denitrobacterium detoxificans]
MDWLTSFFSQYGALLAQGTWDTIVMTVASCAFAYLIGLPMGVAFCVTAQNGLRPHRSVNAVLGCIINIGRSIPFIILLVAIIPFTRFVVGTSLGVPGAIVPLTLSAAPFVARIVEQSLAEVDASLIEAAQAFGASTFQIIVKVLLRESLPSLVRGVSITLVNLFGYSAIAGTVGAGGLGDIAIRYGYQRWQADVMVVAVVLCVVLVQIAQSAGDHLAKRIDHRKRA